MPSIRRFEDIEAWQAARRLTQQVYAVTRREPLAKDRGLSDQLQRASVSVMTNIAEGFDSASNAEFVRFLGFARRSASEVQSHLYVAQDQQYIGGNEFKQLYDLAEKIRRMITAFQRYLRSHRATNTPTRQHANAQTVQV